MTSLVSCPMSVQFSGGEISKFPCLSLSLSLVLLSFRIQDARSVQSSPPAPSHVRMKHFVFAGASVSFSMYRMLFKGDFSLCPAPQLYVGCVHAPSLPPFLGLICLDCKIFGAGTVSCSVFAQCLAQWRSDLG